jgi:hypothetical protein
MAARQHPSLAPGRATGWVGWIVFASIMLIMVGCFNSIDGLAALFKDEVFVNISNGLLVFDLAAWGWIGILLGILQVVVAAAVLSGKVWARMVAVVLVAVNAVEQLAVLGAYPLWAVHIIALDVITNWALVVHGDETRALSRGSSAD